MTITSLPTLKSPLDVLNTYFKNPDSLSRKGYDTEVIGNQYLLDLLESSGLHPLMGNLTNQEIIKFSFDHAMQTKASDVMFNFELTSKQFWPVVESLLLSKRFAEKCSELKMKAYDPTQGWVRLEIRPVNTRWVQYWWIDPDEGIFTQPLPATLSNDFYVSTDATEEPLIDRLLSKSSRKIAGVNSFRAGPKLELVLEKWWFGMRKPFTSKTDNWIKIKDYCDYLRIPVIESDMTLQKYLTTVHNSVSGNTDQTSGFLSGLSTYVPFVGQKEV